MSVETDPNASNHPESHVLTPLTAVSPIDGRYAGHTAALREFCSEFGLIRYRVLVEIRWLQHLSKIEAIEAVPNLDRPTMAYLDDIIETFSVAQAADVKSIEQTTNHDVKAVEYYLQKKLGDHTLLATLIPFIHFACTSEDINNLAYALLIRDARDRVIVPQIDAVIAALRELAHRHAAIAMMSRTHGQTASPTTVGKEFANVVVRLERQQAQLADNPILGKMNGAVGNYNAHAAAYPEVEWSSVGETFVRSLGLTPNTHTTQIEPHDYLAELFDTQARLNTILIDYARDMWGYISLGYFRQKKRSSEVGSSTMPHKVNPIDFENAEGNFGLANAMLAHLAGKLPISRWQRDLTDSTVLRNIGGGFAFTLIGLNALLRGIGKLELDETAIARDLDDAWEVLAEPIQTVMRSHGIADSYERLKELTRGERINKETLHRFLDSLDVDAAVVERLKAMTPSDYIGLAAELARKV